MWAISSTTKDIVWSLILGNNGKDNDEGFFFPPGCCSFDSSFSPVAFGIVGTGTGTDVDVDVDVDDIADAADGVCIFAFAFVVGVGVVVGFPPDAADPTIDQNSSNTRSASFSFRTVEGRGIDGPATVLFGAVDAAAVVFAVVVWWISLGRIRRFGPLPGHVVRCPPSFQSHR